MTNRKWESAPTPEQISRGIARHNIQNLKMTVARIADMYGRDAEQVIQQYALLVMRTSPADMRVLNPKIDSKIEKHTELQPNASVEERAERMAELLKLQNIGSEMYPHCTELKEGMSEAVRGAMYWIGASIAQQRSRQRKMLRINGEMIPAPENTREVVRLRMGDHVDSPYRPFIIDLSKREDAGTPVVASVA